MLFSLCGYLPHSGLGVLEIWVILVFVICSMLRLGKVFRKLILYCLPLRMFLLYRKYPAVQFCLPFGYFCWSAVRCLQTLRYGSRISVSTVFTRQFFYYINALTARHGAEAGFGFGFMKSWFLGHGFGFGTFLRHWLWLRLHNFPRALASASYLSQGFGSGFETNGVASDLTTG